MKDPVTLSGGPLGGTIVEGAKWKIHDIKEIDKNMFYRRLEDDGNALTSDKAVYVGKTIPN
jgi:hypothetical protein